MLNSTTFVNHTKNYSIKNCAWAGNLKATLNKPIFKGSNARGAAQEGKLKLWTIDAEAKFGVSLHRPTNQDQESVSKPTSDG